jgi:hypothetical protein
MSSPPGVRLDASWRSSSFSMPRLAFAGKCEHALVSMTGLRFRACWGPAWSPRVVQPPQADEWQHEGHEPVAAAKPGPHRGVRERVRDELTHRSDCDHAD